MALRQGDQGNVVKELQQKLIACGYTMVADGVFGKNTYRMVKDFQQKQGLTVDGIVGSVTLKYLDNAIDNTSENTARTNSESAKTLTEEDIAEVADSLRVEIPAIKAVYEVESRGKGFLTDGRPKILFEGHIFWRQLKAKNIDPEQYVEGNEDILYAKWSKGHYKGGTAEYDRLERAEKINEDAALASASWGTFQIMGFNYKSCGFDSVKAYVDAQYINEGQHLKAFGGFITAAGLVKHLRNKDWASFAKGYNGSGYKQNKYDEKLANAYEKYAAG